MPNLPTLHFLAGARQLQANAYSLQLTTGFNLLLDAGASSQEHASWVDTLDKPPGLIFLSHVHADHIGALANVLERFPHVRCIASAETCAQMPFALEGILRSRGVSNKAKRQTRAQAIASLVKPIAFGTTQHFELHPGHHIDYQLIPAGHIPGAASLLIDITLDTKFHRFYYLPDFCTHHQPYTPAASPLPDNTPVDTLLVEGALAHLPNLTKQNYDTQLQALLGQLQPTRPRLLGTSALGESIQLIEALKTQTIHPQLIHHSLSPLLLALNFDLAPHQKVASQTECRNALLAQQIVIAPGEHFEQGSPSHMLAQSVVEDRNAFIACFNNTHPKSWLATALKTKRGGIIKPGSLRRRAHIQRFALPNHAPFEDHLEHLEHLAPKHVLLTHGKIKGLAKLARALSNAQEEIHVVHVEIPNAGDTIEL